MSEDDGQQQRGGRIVTRRRPRLIGGIVASLVLVGLGIVYGPRLVSGNYHRAAIERLASGAAGRPVTIAGPIGFSLLPHPQLQAERVTIGGPRGARITAAVLKLDLAPGPLLLGRLRATRLTLSKPDIALPWPLPGGVGAIAPPPWLASLHATIDDGIFRLGPLRLDHANLSIFTGGPHAVIAAAGTVELAGIPARIRLNIDDTGSGAPAPVIASLSLKGVGKTRFDFHGTLNASSVLDGMMTGVLDLKQAAAPSANQKTPDAVAIAGRLAATDSLVIWRNITVASGARRFTGDAVLAIAPEALLRLDGKGENLPLAGLLGVLSRIRQEVPVAGSIRLTNTTAGGVTVPAARAVVLADRAGLRIQSLEATLPGAATLNFSGTLEPSLHGSFTLAAPDPATTVTAFRAIHSGLPAWPGGFGGLHLAGDATVEPNGAVGLEHLHGDISAGAVPSDFTGALRIDPTARPAAVAARFDFARLALDRGSASAIVAGLRNSNPALTGPIALTARQFVWQGGPGQHTKSQFTCTNLQIDASLPGPHAGGGVAVQLAGFKIGHALLIGHGTWSANGSIAAARLSFTGPDARTALGTLARTFGAPPGWVDLPAFQHSFAATLAAAGPADALRTGIALHVGGLRATAIPTVDIGTGSAAGPLTLRAPNAAALIRDLGGAALLGERDGLGWPGPGSASLRAAAFVTGKRIGLSDFVGSLGALTASGRLDLDIATAPPRLSGRIAATTLALPTPSALAALARAALGRAFRIDLPHITADRIERFGVTVASDASFSLALHQMRLAPSMTIGVDHASIAGGTLDGSAVYTAATATAPPTLSLRGHLVGADAASISAIADTYGLDLPLTGGTLDLGTDLTARDTAGKAWPHDLSGSLTASGHKLVLANIDLGQAATTLAAATAARHPIGPIATTHALRTALHSGRTAFDLLDLTASVSDGGIRLDHVSLTGPDGGLDASGTVDLVHERINLALLAHPAIPGHKSSPALTIAITGPPAHPIARPDTSAAVGWIAAHRSKPQAP